jgi:hypothetical protein
MSVSAVSTVSAVFGQKSRAIKDAPSSFEFLDEHAFSRFSAVSAVSVNRVDCGQDSVNDAPSSGTGRSRRRRSLNATPAAAPGLVDPRTPFTETT